MFIDSAKIHIKSGDGGNGAVTFHREKYIAAGGPDGGDGGKGGNVIFIVEQGTTTLQDFRYKRKYVADSGKNGDRNKRCGKSAEDLIIKIPCGTIIKDLETDKLIADLITEGQTFTALKGGKGGKGNSHFVTSARQVPNFAQNGEEGKELNIKLELKLLADVGLVGFPSVGKSTILSKVTSAQPKIAEYHFTTLQPNLGVVSIGMDESFVLADIPGLIEGANLGLGLGHDFLKHIERTRFIIHVIDVATLEGRDPVKDFEIINNELKAFNPLLADKPQVIAANKMDISGADENYVAFQEVMSKKGYEVFPISAATGAGLDKLMSYVYEQLQTLPVVNLIEKYDEFVLYTAEKERLFEITIEEGVYVVDSKWIRKLIGSVNIEDYESMQYFQRVLRSKGIIAALEEEGCKDGDSVRVYNYEFDFVD